jgi:hypothetical protein
MIRTMHVCQKADGDVSEAGVWRQKFVEHAAEDGGTVIHVRTLV